jgi:hypothetical protein
MRKILVAEFAMPRYVTACRRQLVLMFGLFILALQVVSSSCLAEDGYPMSATPWYEGHISGQSRSEYEYRSSDGEHDSDLYEYLYFSDRDLANRHLDFYFSGRFQKDLNNLSTSLADNEFASIDDLTSDYYLFQLYLEAHDIARDVLFRGGRQYIDVADSLHIDGGQLMAFENSRFGGQVFYGRPVSYYSSVSNDWAGGFSLIGRPWAQNQTRLTYVRYHDDSADVDDQHYALDVRQRFDEELRSQLQVSELNKSFEMASLDLYYDSTAGDFGGYVGVRRWGDATGDTIAYSPLLQVLGSFDPYTYVCARTYMNVLPWLYIAPEFTARMVATGDENAQNTDYTHYDLTISIEPDHTWSASVAGEYWDVRGGDSFFGVSGELRYRHGRLWEISAGTGYTHYDYTQYVDYTGTIDAGDVHFSGDGSVMQDSPDSYSYFLAGKWNLNKTFAIQARGEMETDTGTNETNGHSLMAQITVVLRI